MPHLKKIKVRHSSTEDVPYASKHLSPPSFYINAAQMPEIKGWKVGGKYRLIIEVEQKSMNKREDSTDASFDILAYRHIPEKSIDEMTDKEFGDYQGEALDKASKGENYD